VDNAMGHSLGHFSNIKKKIKTFSRQNKIPAQNAMKRYQEYHEIVENALRNGDYASAVEILNNYVDYAKDLEKNNSKFNWRSDYAGSIIPEFLMMAVAIEIENDDLQCLFSTKKSVVEVNIQASGELSVRNKNQDFSVGTNSASIQIGEDIVEFLVPVVVVEVKTNIDINKLNGLDYSASRLKTTFPECSYFLATETVDFSLDDNYITTSLDEIYCLRKQMRSKARKNKAPLAPDSISLLVADIVNQIKQSSIVPPHVYDRLDNGKLIQRGVNE